MHRPEISTWPAHICFWCSDRKGSPHSPYYNSHNASVIRCLPVPVPAKWTQTFILCYMTNIWIRGGGIVNILVIRLPNDPVSTHILLKVLDNWAALQEHSSTTHVTSSLINTRYYLSNSSQASSLLKPYSVAYKINTWQPGSEYLLL